MNAPTLCPRCIVPISTPVCPTCGTEAVTARRRDVNTSAPLTGQTLGGRFEIGDLIGEGGMGKVYRGLQLPLRREVAIKVIANAGEAGLHWHKRFLREAKVTSRLTHPNNIRLYDFGYTDAGELYMVMELLHGQDLAAFIQKRRRLTPGHAIAICRQVLGALAEAHGQGIVHRDLKPGNVFLCDHADSEHVKVMDFGLAKVHADPDFSKLTRTGAVMGTPAYMPPEQARSQQTDARTDIYSLGVMLFEMLVGRVPFSASTMLGLLMAQVQAKPPRLAHLHPSLPAVEEFQALLDAMLAKDPDLRPSSAEEVLARLDAIDLGQATEASDGSDATEMMDVVVVSVPADDTNEGVRRAIAHDETIHDGTVHDGAVHDGTSPGARLDEAAVAGLRDDELPTSEMDIIGGLSPISDLLKQPVRPATRMPKPATRARRKKPGPAPTAPPPMPVVTTTLMVEIRLAGAATGANPQLTLLLDAGGAREQERWLPVTPLLQDGQRWSGSLDLPQSALATLAYRLQIHDGDGARWRLRVNARRQRRSLLLHEHGRVEGTAFRTQGRRGGRP